MMRRLLVLVAAVLMSVRPLHGGLNVSGSVDQTTDQERERIMRMSQSDLEAYLVSGHGGESARQLAVLRLFTTPDWTVRWSFWIAVGACVFAGIAAWPVIQNWFVKHDDTKQT